MLTHLEEFVADDRDFLSSLVTISQAPNPSFPSPITCTSQHISMSRSLSRALRPLLASTSRSITANHRSAISFAYSSSSSVIAAPSPSSSPLSRLSRRTYATSPTPPTGLDEGERLIYEKLKARFGGKQLEVQDVSGEHATFLRISPRLLVSRSHIPAGNFLFARDIYIPCDVREQRTLY